ncbi:unnamed protein product, partial [Ectocarpus sp. 4 AP-2014]
VRVPWLNIPAPLIKYFCLFWHHVERHICFEWVWNGCGIVWGVLPLRGLVHGSPCPSPCKRPSSRNQQGQLFVATVFNNGEASSVQTICTFDAATPLITTIETVRFEGKSPMSTARGTPVLCCQNQGAWYVMHLT